MKLALTKALLSTWTSRLKGQGSMNLIGFGLSAEALAKDASEESAEHEQVAEEKSVTPVNVIAQSQDILTSLPRLENDCPPPQKAMSKVEDPTPTPRLI